MRLHPRSSLLVIVHRACIAIPSKQSSVSGWHSPRLHRVTNFPLVTPQHHNALIRLFYHTDPGQAALIRFIVRIDITVALSTRRHGLQSHRYGPRIPALRPHPLTMSQEALIAMAKMNHIHPTSTHNTLAALLPQADLCKPTTTKTPMRLLHSFTSKCRLPRTTV